MNDRSLAGSSNVMEEVIATTEYPRVRCKFRKKGTAGIGCIAHQADVKRQVLRLDC